MTEKKKLLELKKNMDKKRPAFTREGSQNSVRIGTKWRKPRGLQSKMRHQFAGHKARVKIGYGSPAQVRNLDRQGYNLIKINNIAELEKINPETDKIILSSKLGIKSKIAIFEKCIQKKILIYNFKGKLEDKITEYKESLKARKQKKETKVAEKKKKKTALKKDELEKKVMSEEDKKKEEKKEMDKVLTKRG